jgi:hypothetical protein
VKPKLPVSDERNRQTLPETRTVPAEHALAVQLEEVANALRKKQTHNAEGDDDEDGAPPPEVQVLLYSSRRFGPQSIRELTVGLSCCSACHCNLPLVGLTLTAAAAA